MSTSLPCRTPATQCCPRRRRAGRCRAARRLRGAGPHPSGGCGSAAARWPAATQAEAARLLTRTGLDPALAHRLPAQLSGGERQRAAIARALAARPRVLVCDEITSALDTTTAAGVLALLDELRAELGIALLFVSHDLALVAGVADRLLVLDAGRVCEQGPASEVLAAATHPVTRALLAARPARTPAAPRDRAVRTT